MLKQSIQAVLVFAAVAVFSQNQAHAFGLSAVGSYNVATISTSPAPATVPTSKGTIGGGALLNFSAFPAFDWEIGALYTPYKSTTPLSTSTSNSLYIPVLLRFKLLPIVSVAGGLNYSLPMGDSTTVAGGVTTTATQKSNYGATLSAALRLPLAPMMGLLVDARYNLGFKDLSTVAGTTVHANTFQVLAGLNFSM